jgi:hypothetical protein
MIKFRLISRNWEKQAIPLSGINQSNIKKVYLVNKKELAFKTWK